MSVLVGVVIGLLFPFVSTHAGRTWSVIYGAAFVASVCALDARSGLSDREVTSLLIGFSAAVFFAWGVMRRAAQPPPA
jgi:hypothetical protein